MFKALQFKIKVFKAYFSRVFFPHKEDAQDEWYRTWFLRYANYSIGDSLCVVDDRTGKYSMTSMPWPFYLPGRLYWWISDKRNRE